MGFFSWKCAVSKQSIPAACIEPTDVSLFLANGTIVAGEYDGYGRIMGIKEIDVVQAVKEALIAVGDWTPIARRQLQKVELGVLLAGQQSQRCWKFTYLENGTPESWTPPESYTGRLATENDARAWFEKNALAEAEFELMYRSVKLVKTKYVSPELQYKSLAFSGECKYQGFFYPRKGQWNTPAYPAKRAK